MFEVDDSDAVWFANDTILTDSAVVKGRKRHVELEADDESKALHKPTNRAATPSEATSLLADVISILLLSDLFVITQDFLCKLSY